MRFYRYPFLVEADIRPGLPLYAYRAPTQGSEKCHGCARRFWPRALHGGYCLACRPREPLKLSKHCRGVSFRPAHRPRKET